MIDVSNTPVIKHSPYANNSSMHGRSVNIGQPRFTRPCSKVWVGTGGDLQVLLFGDAEPITLCNIQSGTMLDLCVIQIMSGSARDVVALF